MMTFYQLVSLEGPWWLYSTPVAVTVGNETAER